VSDGLGIVIAGSVELAWQRGELDGYLIRRLI
jgi:hypothetical protein